MTKFGLQNVMCDHGVEKFTFHFHPVILKDKNIVLDILSDFHWSFIFVERPELIYYF